MRAADPASDSSGRESRPATSQTRPTSVRARRGREELPLDQTPGAGDQLVARGGQEQSQRLPGARLDGAAAPIQARSSIRAGCPATPEWPR